MTQEAVNQPYVVKLDVFEGPLDLLLHLIRKHELDILDIPVAFVTAKYLEYLELMKALNLDILSDYLEMAAYLALLKSRTMLPPEPGVDNDDFEDIADPREDLVRRLLEYQKYKEAADQLSGRPLLGRDSFARGAGEELSIESELRSPGLFALIEAFRKIMETAQVDQFDRITVTRISVTARIQQLVDIMQSKRRVTFVSLFSDSQTRSDFVVTFLALLEMTRLGMTRLHQTAAREDLYVIAAPGIDATEDVLSNVIEEET